MPASSSDSGWARRRGTVLVTVYLTVLVLAGLAASSLVIGVVAAVVVTLLVAVGLDVRRRAGTT
jgi:energy-converting hydrogenase Eha subunit B